MRVDQYIVHKTIAHIWVKSPNLLNQKLYVADQVYGVIMSENETPIYF